MNVTNFNAITNTITVASHGLFDGDYVEFFSTDTLPTNINVDTEYQVIVVDVDNIQIFNKRDPSMTVIDIVDSGVGLVTIKKVSTSEQFLKAWDEFYSYQDAPSYIFVLETVENHFRKLGFNITRLLAPSNKTIRWKIEW